MTFILRASLAAIALAAAPLVHAASLAQADIDFVNKAAQSGQYEVLTGGLGKSKGTAPPTKAFATQMVTDHTKSGEELKALAQKKGLQVPTELADKQKQQMKMLESTGSGAFDKAYAKDNVMAHEEAVALFRKASQDAADPDLKAFAGRTLPTLEHHLKMAKDLDSSLNATK